MLVRATTSRPGREAFSRRVASMPSIPGMRTSISTTSGESCRTSSIASTPERAWPITSRSSPDSRKTRDSRNPSLSSTTSTRMRPGRGRVAATEEVSADDTPAAIPRLWVSSSCNLRPPEGPQDRCAGVRGTAGILGPDVTAGRTRPRGEPTDVRWRDRRWQPRMGAAVAGTAGSRNVPGATSTSPRARLPQRRPSCNIRLSTRRPAPDSRHRSLRRTSSRDTRGVIR
jgi:hypothetical protein